MIEGQPQLVCDCRCRAAEFSGLVIEGQPQLFHAMVAMCLQFSGLVIEGQPQLLWIEYEKRL